MITFAPFIHLLLVITKAGGIRPDESLATLYYKEGATFYSDLSETDNHENSLSLSHNIIYL
jgi:hypothetical protein